MSEYVPFDGQYNSFVGRAMYLSVIPLVCPNVFVQLDFITTLILKQQNVFSKYLI